MCQILHSLIFHPLFHQFILKIQGLLDNYIKKKKNNNINSVIFHNIGDIFNQHSKGIWEMAIQEILSI